VHVIDFNSESSQFNRVARAIWVEPQEKMRWKRFGIIIFLHLFLLFGEFKEEDWLKEVWF